MHAEIFGPLCAVQPAASLDAAIRLANVTPYRLVCTVFGHDATALDSVTKEVDFGLIRRNLPTTGLDYNAPFGGAGMASYGPPEQGEAALVFFTRNVTITD
jgi:aldehyde dehydrogenase (NAD+)